jgi:hypothetical protein
MSSDKTLAAIGLMRFAGVSQANGHPMGLFVTNTRGRGLLCCFAAH